MTRTKKTAAQLAEQKRKARFGTNLKEGERKNVAVKLRVDEEIAVAIEERSTDLKMNRSEYVSVLVRADMKNDGE